MKTFPIVCAAFSLSAYLVVTGCRSTSALSSPKRFAASMSPSSPGIKEVATPGTVTGHVQNIDGKPVPNASVWVMTAFSGRKRQETNALTATTDADGNYRVSGLHPLTGIIVERGGLDVTVVAYKPGLPPDIVQFKDTTGNSKADLLLPSQGAKLTVRILSPDGTPAANTAVQIRSSFSQAVPGVGTWNHDTEIATEARAVLSPQAMTDTNGVAHFSDLIPGHYTVYAAKSDKPTEPFRRLLNFYTSDLVARCTGVSVSVDSDNDCRLRLQPPQAQVVLHFAFPDGLPESNIHAHITAPPASAPDKANASGTFIDARKIQAGMQLGISGDGGFQRVTVEMGQQSGDRFAIPDPSLFGATVIAHSRYWKRPSLTLPVAPVLRGKVRIRILDENGNPVPDMLVRVGKYTRFRPPFGYIDRNEVSDANGYAVFSDIPAGEASFYAIPRSKQSLINDSYPNPNTPFPPDREIADQRIWRVQTVSVVAGAQTDMGLKAVHAGYLRGKVSGAPYGAVSVPQKEEQAMGTTSQYNPATGEYLIGPLAPGSVEVSFFSSARPVVGTVSVAPGINRHDITSNSGSPLRIEDIAVRHRQLEKVQGIVYLPDGKTPAFGSNVRILSPADAYDNIGFTTDAQGHLRLNRLGEYGFTPTRYTTEDSPTPPPSPGGPTERIIIAYLPGSHGAIWQPFPESAESQPIKLILPAPVSLRGKVTIAGRPTATVPGFVTIRAEYTGQGILNPYLSQELTAESDGSFSLAGLTPGTYRIQAALENVYFSSAQVITIPHNAHGNLPPLTLALPEPGESMVLSLGKPYAGMKATLVDPLPDGPFAADRYPAYFIADGAGQLRLEGLPAGIRRLRLSNGKIVSATIGRRDFKR